MAISMKWIDVGPKYIANQVALIVSLLNIWYCGRRFYLSAFRQLRIPTANMDTLVCFSTAISFTYSAIVTLFFANEQGGQQWPVYFDASVMIITFVLTGRLLEERANNATASSIRTLMGL